MHRLVPRCSARTLFIFAALVWMIAGSMVMKLGYQVLIYTRGYKLLSIAVAILVFLIFYNRIFKKMAYKHQVRIKSKEQEKVCMFSFFDKKGYIIMGCMMSLGILIRSASFINPLCWAAFYVGLGTALFSAGILFVKGWITWNR